MKNGLVIVTGAFLTLAFSWAVLILLNANHPLYGQLEPHEDELTGEFVPSPTAGIAERGREIFVEMGCVACHTQQVRRPGFGGDAERGWGERQSVGRDYVGQRNVHLGTLRIGPDLRNVGQREVPEEWGHLTWDQYHFLHLYDPRIVVPGSVMPSFPFLFEERRFSGERSPQALPLRNLPEGHEVVPTRRAKALAAYLRSLRLDYNLPEAEHLTIEARQQQNEQE